jgi:uncharacterized protein (DUF697 family)/tellurite resistance protein
VELNTNRIIIMSVELSQTEKESILTLCLMAALADGGKSDVERAELKRIAENFPESNVNLASVYHRVLLRQVSTVQAAQALTTPETRQLAYEMAVCVCEADDVLNEAEKQFLAGLRRELRLEAAETARIEHQADALALEPLADPASTTAPLIATATAAATPAVAPPEVDRMILNYAILNGALELLPDSLATMAIIPLQMKMVYRIGKAHGYELDRGHIKELLGAAGVGLTSQVVEGCARKLLGGLLGKFGGGMVRSAGKQVASSAMSFATTWALGRVAHQYYAGGRKLSAIELRQLFGSLTEQARGLHAKYAGAIRDKAGSLNLSQLLPLIRGQQ